MKKIALVAALLLTSCNAAQKATTLRLADSVGHLTGKVEQYDQAHDALHFELAELERQVEEEGPEAPGTPWTEIVGSVATGMLGLWSAREWTRRKALKAVKTPPTVPPVTGPKVPNTPGLWRDPPSGWTPDNPGSGNFSHQDGGQPG